MKKLLLSSVVIFTAFSCEKDDCRVQAYKDYETDNLTNITLEENTDTLSNSIDFDFDWDDEDS